MKCFWSFTGNYNFKLWWRAFKYSSHPAVLGSIPGTELKLFNDRSVLKIPLRSCNLYLMVRKVKNKTNCCYFNEAKLFSMIRKCLLVSIEILNGRFFNEPSDQCCVHNSTFHWFKRNGATWHQLRRNFGSLSIRDCSSFDNLKITNA